MTSPTLRYATAALLFCTACSEQHPVEQPSAKATQPVLPVEHVASPTKQVTQPGAMTEPIAPERKTKLFDKTKWLVNTVEILANLHPH